MSEPKNAEDIVTEFENKSGDKFVLSYNHFDDIWVIVTKKLKPSMLMDEASSMMEWFVCRHASFKQQSKAIEFCELLKESE